MTPALEAAQLPAAAPMQTSAAVGGAASLTTKPTLGSQTAGVTGSLGSPWTADEHLAFLKGLSALGKGRWKEIARMFVVSRSPTQVASHAQKHFLRLSRQGAASASRRRSRFAAVEHEACAQGLLERDPATVPAAAVAPVVAPPRASAAPAPAPSSAAPAAARAPPPRPLPPPLAFPASVKRPRAREQSPLSAAAAKAKRFAHSSALDALLAAACSAEGAFEEEERAREQQRQQRQRLPCEAAAAAAEAPLAARTALEAQEAAAAGNDGGGAAPLPRPLPSSQLGCPPPRLFVADEGAACCRFPVAAAAALRPVARVPSDLDLAKLAAGLSAAAAPATPAATASDDAVVPGGGGPAGATAAAAATTTATTSLSSPAASSAGEESAEGATETMKKDKKVVAASASSSDLRGLGSSALASAFVVPTCG